MEVVVVVVVATPKIMGDKERQKGRKTEREARPRCNTTDTAAQSHHKVDDDDDLFTDESRREE